MSSIDGKWDCISQTPMGDQPSVMELKSNGNVVTGTTGYTSYIVGATGVKLQSLDGGCSANDRYGIGWSNTNNVGNACGVAPVPSVQGQVYSFLQVIVNGTTVTVNHHSRVLPAGIICCVP